MDDLEEKTNDEKKGEWNSKLEEAVQAIGQAAQGYKHMHIWQAQRATSRHKYLMGSGIVIGPLASVLQSIGLALNMETDPVISVFVILFGFISGIIVATVKFGKYDEVSNSNKSAAAKYTSIEANVRRQLGLYRKDRMPAIAYMDWLETKYEGIMMSAPLLTASVFNRYSKHAEATGLPVPEQYDHMITITEEYTSTSTQVKEISNEVPIQVNITDDMEGSKKNHIKRSNTMVKIPEINCASDKILAYELNRLMSIR